LEEKYLPVLRDLTCACGPVVPAITPANFDPWGVAEKEEKKKRRLPNKTCHSKLFFLECLLDEAWTIFEAIHRQFYENEPPRPQKKS
jgi:hypothetical protein